MSRRSGSKKGGKKFFVSLYFIDFLLNVAFSGKIARTRVQEESGEYIEGLKERR
jgi:hypothetical protein